MRIDLFKAGFLVYVLGAQGVGANGTVDNRTVANPVANQTVNLTGDAAVALQACKADLGTCKADLEACSDTKKEVEKQLDIYYGIVNLCRTYTKNLHEESANCSRNLDAWKSYSESWRSYSEFLKNNLDSLENSLYLCRKRQNMLKNCTDQVKDCEQNTTSEKTNQICYGTFLGMSPLRLLGGFSAAGIIVETVFIIILLSRIKKLKEVSNTTLSAQDPSAQDPSGQDPSGQDPSDQDHSYRNITRGVLLSVPDPTAPPAHLALREVNA